MAYGLKARSCHPLIIHTLRVLSMQSFDRLSKNRQDMQEEENTITFRLKCIVIA